MTNPLEHTILYSIGRQRDKFHCIVLYRTVLHSTVLYCTVLCYSVLSCTVLNCTALRFTILHCTALYCTVLYYAILYFPVMYCTVQCRTAFCYTALYWILLHCAWLHCTLHDVQYSTLHNVLTASSPARWLFKKAMGRVTRPWPIRCTTQSIASFWPVTIWADR